MARSPEFGSLRAVWSARDRHVRRIYPVPGKVDLHERRSFAAWLRDGLSGGGWHIPRGPRAAPADPGAPPEDRDAATAAAFRNARAAMRKTQEHVALEAGLSVRTVRRAEAIGRVSDENVRALMSALDMRMPTARDAADPDGGAPEWARVLLHVRGTLLRPLPMGAAAFAAALVALVSGSDHAACFSMDCDVTGQDQSDILLAMLRAQMFVYATALLSLAAPVLLGRGCSRWRSSAMSALMVACCVAAFFSSVPQSFRILETAYEARGADAVRSMRASAAGHPPKAGRPAPAERPEPR